MTKTEIITESVIKCTVPKLLTIVNSYLPLTDEICDARKRDLHHPLGYNILSCNAETKLLTEKGNPRRIEFRLDFQKTNKVVWVDAKHLLKPSDISNVCAGDMQRALKLNGELWIVFYGNGYNNYTINNLEEFRNYNVRFIRSIDELKLNLLGEI